VQFKWRNNVENKLAFKTKSGEQTSGRKSTAEDPSLLENVMGFATARFCIFTAKRDGEGRINTQKIHSVHRNSQ
jgi:hypothetical protein